MTITNSIPGQPRPRLSAKGKAELDQIMVDAVDSREQPAIMWGVANSEEELYFNWRGERVFGHPEEGLVDDDTVLEIYSMTKMVVALGLLQLQDRGVLSLDDPDVVDKYCPELISQPVLEGYTAEGEEVFVPRTAAITARFMLTHQVGLAYSFCNDNFARWEREHKFPFFTVPHAGVNEYTTPLMFQPGSQWCYGLSSDWAGILLQRVSGQTLDDYFREHLWEPLGVKTMTFFPTEEVRKHMMAMCNRTPEGKLVAPGESLRVPDDKTVNVQSGGGGLFGSARDYLRLLRGILASRRPGGIISPEAYRELFTNSLPPRGEGKSAAPHYANIADMIGPYEYFDPVHVANGGQYLEHSVGFALTTKDSSRGRKAGTGAWGGAAKTEYWIDPASGIAAVCCTQIMRSNPDPFGKVYRAFERTIYDNLEPA